jgi:hypothetical protein
MSRVKPDSSRSGLPAVQDGGGGPAVAGRVAAYPGRDQVSQRCAGVPARASQVCDRVISTTVRVKHGAQIDMFCTP